MRILFIACFVVLCAPANAQKADSVFSSDADGILSSYRSWYTDKSHEYSECLQWCAMQCVLSGDNKQAVTLLKESDRRFKLYGRGNFAGRDTINQILKYDILIKIEQNSERNYYAIKYAKRSLNLKRQFFGEESEQSLNALLDLSQLYAERLKYKKAAKFHNKGYRSYVELLKKEFCSSSELKRGNYWKVASLYVGKTLTEAYKFAGNKKFSVSSMAIAAYNANLLSKGILLNSTIDFENFVRNSNSLAAKRLFEERMNTKNLLVKDSLDYEILRVLKNEGKEYRIPQLSITWEDVSHKLGDHDVAIEFYRTASKEYGALVIKKGWRAPKNVRLKNQIKIGKKYVMLENAMRSVVDYLKNENKEDPSYMWNLSRAIWSDALLMHLPEERDAKIYFSADGLLQLVGLESLPFNMPGEKGFARMSDIYNLYRLSSTRVLAMEREETHASKAALYGDILYAVEDSVMKKESEKYAASSSTDTVKRGASLYNDKVIVPLSWTGLEVDTIYAILSKRNAIEAERYVRSKGNEESFKNIYRINPKILHIATHGFYEPPAAKSSAQNDTHSLIDESMQRTGLYLAGAQKARMYKDYVIEGVEDGILTAYEISQTNLNNLDIAVLSACETALGDITADGVAGLQRGFKQAGTNSLLMSLWPVNDGATCKLMTNFYSNWIEHKMSKHDALEAAKKAVRETPGWEDPKFWAAFILLDALD